MKHLYIFMCLIGFTMVSTAQNNIAMLSLAHIEETHIQQNTPIQSDTLISLNYSQTITGLSVSGTAILDHSSNSLVRITLQDDYNTEWLVYELFPLLTDSNVVTFDNVAFETSVLDNITAKWLKVKIINATLQLTDINTSNQAVASYSLQQSRAMEAQSSYIIDKLNENLEKRNIPWRAGETSVSQMTYEEKKAMFGGEVPNLGGLEYYKGGIFVMPGYEVRTANEGTATASTTSTTEEEDLYVKEWDWRNRHGKNWMTPVKDQGGCGSCGAFSTIGLLESYINIYYNKLLDYDLSEQELVSCLDRSQYISDPESLKICGGIAPEYAFKYIRNNGIVNEDCFSYTASLSNCSNKCSAPTEKIYTTSHSLFNNLTEIDIKKELFKSPIIIDINSWKHSMVLIGYKTLQLNDTIWYTNNEGYNAVLILRSGNPYIGTSAWIFKNSWGNSWGSYDGFYYVLANTNDFANILTLKGSVWNSTYNNNIEILDEDDDGYYTWGVGEKPSSLPDWIPNEQDGDDSNDTYGPINEYGYLRENNLIEYPYEIRSETYLSNILTTFSIVIKEGGTLFVNDTITMHKDATIIVERGGKMIIDGGIINKANITVLSGGEITLKNNGEINLKSNDSFIAENGSTVLIEEGFIK